MPSAGPIDLRATHLRYGAEAYQSNVAAAVDGVVRQTVLRGGLTIIAASFRIEAEVSSQVLLPPGLSLNMLLDGRATIDDEPHGSGTYTFDVSATSYWRRLRAAPGQMVRFVSLSASPRQLHSLGLDDVGANNGVAHRGRMPDRIAGLALLLAQNERASPAVNLLREAAGLELVGRLLDDHDPTMAHGGGLSPQERRALDQVQTIIATELDADLTLAALARRVGLGLSSLKKLYHRQHGRPVGASIIEARLMRAHRLLSDESQQVAEVAYAVGYTPAHLATAFRRRFGYSPSHVRRALPG